MRKNTKAVFSILALLLVVSMLLAACGGATATPSTAAPTKAPAVQPTAVVAQPTTPPTTKKFTIGVSNSFISSEYRTQMIQELKDVNQEYMGKGIGNDLVIESADTDVPGQIQQLQNLINTSGPRPRPIGWPRNWAARATSSRSKVFRAIRPTCCG